MPDDKNVATILAICDLITSKQIAIHNANVRRSLSKKGYRSKETARRGRSPFLGPRAVFFRFIDSRSTLFRKRRNAIA